MFKLLNPYQMLSPENNMPIDRIELGRTPHLSRFLWNAGDTPIWLNWRDFSRRSIKVAEGRGNKEATITVGEYLLRISVWLRGELNAMKFIGSLPWDPADRARRWFLPYLKISDIDELKDLLDGDIAFLQDTLSQD